ncbi:delta 4 [Brachionus plicatilis]|uniref:Delta 4 n=1 Tax=Brachionus plicatilis TaxID=10195 RepID=A0A3M7Q150_BRAPC|nr:delta 4 [Brachionus plicatilis]
MFKLVYFLLLGLVLGYSEAISVTNREFIGLCSSSPCKNGASCIQLGYNLAICLCKSEFSGIYCDIPKTTTRSTTVTTTPLALCTPEVCKNSGTCVQINQNLAICICAPGFFGEYCQDGSPITTTLSDAPTSSISTVAPTSSISTVAPTSSSDPTASTVSTPSQIPFEICPIEPIICRNNGTCIVTTNTRFVTCFCKTGFTGTLCEDST